MLRVRLRGSNPFGFGPSHRQVPSFSSSPGGLGRRHDVSGLLQGMVWHQQTYQAPSNRPELCQSVACRPTRP